MGSERRTTIQVESRLDRERRNNAFSAQMSETLDTYFSVAWLSLDHELIETHVERFKRWTIVRILLPTRAHYLIIMIMAIIGLEESECDRESSFRFHSTTTLTLGIR